MISRHCGLCTVAGLAVPLLLWGCGSRPVAERLVGHWHGTSTSSGVSVPADWQFNRDGSETDSLSLPQGALTAQGTWAIHAPLLTQRTTSRSVVIGGQQKKMLLLNPMESTYRCTLTDNTLSLTRPEAQETITLRRDTK